MKKGTVLITILLFVFSCKNKNTGNLASQPTHSGVTQAIILPNYPLWILNRLALIKINENLKQTDKQVFKLYRTSTTETAYASVNNIPVIFGNIYRASVLVRKDELLAGSFGLRIIGEYPNRVDAVYDLENGILKGVADVGNFSNGDAKIEDVGEGWFKCSLTAKLNADLIKIILGPTSGLGKIITWEGINAEKSSVYIIPSSLVLEELAQ